MSSPAQVGIIGATSLVGQCAIDLLLAQGHTVVAFSRRERQGPTTAGVTWAQLDTSDAVSADHSRVDFWLVLAPIWMLSPCFAHMQGRGAQRVVVLSSTSRFTKAGSSDMDDALVAERLVAGESDLQSWAASQGMEWVILRPTLIYGFGLDKNLSEIARFVRRFFFFPLFSDATGLRQPIHARDVAQACVAALRAPAAANRAYNIAGREAVTYREMVSRVFVAARLRPRLVTIPLFVFRIAIAMASVLPRYRNWSVGMAQRMNKDMVFDCGDATRDLGFAPQVFAFGPEDLPR